MKNDARFFATREVRSLANEVPVVGPKTLTDRSREVAGGSRWLPTPTARALSLGDVISPQAPRISGVGKGTDKGKG